MTGLLGRSFLAAAVIIGLVILRALLLHRLPKFTFQAAWAVVILRLLIPFSVPVFDAPDTKAVSWVTDILAGDGREWAVSVGSSQAAGIVRGSDAGRYFGNLSVADSRKIGSSGQDSGITSRKNHGQDKANIADFTENLKQNQEQNMIKTAPGTSNPQSTKTAAKNGTGRVAILRGIWLAGTLSVLFFFLFSHLRAKRLYSTAIPVSHPLPEMDLFQKSGLFCRIPAGLFRNFRKSVRRNVTVKVSDRIFAPVTYGVLSPVILLPKSTDWENTEQLRMVLGHETVHIRRFDILYKWLLAAAVALHWFNPFVLVMYILANRDIELSCDEAVIRCLAGQKKKDYALALLSYEEKRMFSPTVSSFGGNAVRERMEAIMKTNKKSVIGMAMAAILVAGTTTVFAGVKDAKKDLPDGQQQSASGTQAAGRNTDSQNTDLQDTGGKNKDGEENNSGNTPRTVKQYICEPAYYTPEEFAKAMEEELKALKNEVAQGMLTQDAVDERSAELEEQYREVKNGRQIEKPSPVYDADGTPLISSDGTQLYAKASDIERMNRDLREAAEYLGNIDSVEGMDTVIEAKFTEGGLFGGIPDDFKLPETDISMYGYEEYREYAEKQKEEYRRMKGQWGFNLTDGWFEWDDEKIETACRLLDENLEFIKNGGKISRPDADGTVLMVGSSKFNFESADDEKWMVDEAKWAMSLAEAKEKGYDVVTAEKMSGDGKFDIAFLKAYDAFGVTVDDKTGSYLYQGKKVAGFWDAGTVMADGAALEENGIYLKGVREDGKLIRIVEITKEEFCELSGLAM